MLDFKYKRNAWLALALMSAGGCAVIKATQQPDKKDLHVLTPGVARTAIIAEVGPPIWSEEHKGELTDVFRFKQGYTKQVRAGRALGHGAADFLTFGLWEVVGTPVETLADGSEVKVEVKYDEDRKVRSINVLEGEKLVYDKEQLEKMRRGQPQVAKAADKALR